MITKGAELGWGVSAGILIDTNLLLVYLVGLWNPEEVGRHKRTQEYTTEDFDSLRSLAQRFRVIVTTPHILAELSNLISNRPKPRKEPGPIVGELLLLLRRVHEVYVAKDELLELRWLPRIGVADAATIGVAAKEKCIVLTDDLDLTQCLETENLRVINFTRARTSGWLSESPSRDGRRGV